MNTDHATDLDVALWEWTKATHNVIYESGRIALIDNDGDVEAYTALNDAYGRAINRFVEAVNTSVAEFPGDEQRLLPPTVRALELMATALQTVALKIGGAS